jgi:GNAT superfamily N-acetyltransferase
MTPTLEDIEASFHEHVFLKAVLNDAIVGSIRARIAEGSCFIGRLIVDPKFQHQGIGRRLLSTMEALYPGLRFELFTGHLSKRTWTCTKKWATRPSKPCESGIGNPWCIWKNSRVVHNGRTKFLLSRTNGLTVSGRVGILATTISRTGR